MAQRERLIVSCIAAASIAVFAQSLGFEFAFDDLRTIEQHPGVRGPLSWSNLFALDYWGHRFDSPLRVGTYRPLVTLTYWLGARLSRGALAQHAMNLVLFGGLIVAAARMLRRLCGDALDDRARYFGLAAFGALAIHSDVVPSVAGRSELMASLLVVLAIDAALDAPRSTGAVVGSALAFAASLLCKESTLPFAVVLPWLAWRRAERSDRARVAALASASAAIAGVFTWFRATHLGFRVQGPLWHFSNPMIDAPTSVRVGGVGDALFRYLQHTFVPVDLCPDYAYGALSPELGPRAAIGFAVLLAAAIAVVWSARRAPALCELLVVAGASYFVVSHIAVPGSAFVADRVFFLPSLFLCALLALFASTLLRASPRSARLLGLVAGAMIAVQAVLAALATPAWRDNNTLSAYAVQSCPANLRMHIFRAEIVWATGANEDTAWLFLLSSAVAQMFPARVDSDVMAELLEAPAERRAALFVTRFGRDRFVAAALSARTGLGVRRYEDAVPVINRWLRDVGAVQ